MDGKRSWVLLAALVILALPAESRAGDSVKFTDGNHAFGSSDAIPGWVVTDLFGNSGTYSGLLSTFSIAGTENNNLGSGLSGSSGNTITVDYTPGSAALNLVAGGESETGTVSGNRVSIVNGPVKVAVVGGITKNGSATGNQVTIGSGVEIGVSVGAGAATQGIGYIYGGYVSGGSGSAVGNGVTVENGARVHTTIYGGYVQDPAAPHSANSGSGDARDNWLLIKGGDFWSDLIGGKANRGNVSGNSVVVAGDINGDASSNGIWGGLTESGNAENNRVEIGAVTVHEFHNISGGATSAQTNASASHNTIVLSGTKLTENTAVGMSDSLWVIGGAVGDSTNNSAQNNLHADYNTVTLKGAVRLVDSTTSQWDDYIAGGAIGGNGVAITGNVTANHNTVNVEVSGDFDLSEFRLRGGMIIGASAAGIDLKTGNTLNTVFSGKTITVIDISNFENYNFTLPSGSAQWNSDIIYSINSSGAINPGNVLPVNLSGTKISLTAMADRELAAGDKVILFDKVGATSPDSFAAQVQSGVALSYEVEGAISGGAYEVTVKSTKGVTPFTESLSQAQISSLLLGNLSVDFATQLGIGAALDALEARELGSAGTRSRSAYASPAAPAGGPAVFAVMDGGSSSFRTGGDSRLELDQISLLAGLGWRGSLGCGRLLLGGFFTGGWGRYDSKIGGVKYADHDAMSYFGGGVLARLDLQSGLYGDAQFQIGRDLVKYDGLVPGVGVRASFRRHATYVGLGAGLGYQFALGSGRSDFSLRYNFGHSSGDDLHIAGGDFSLGSLSSHRLRLGARHYFTACRVTPFAGAAFEYEFDGKSSGSVYGYALRESRLRGGTGSAELGVRYAAGRVSAELGARGYLGKRRGVAGNLSLGLSF